MNDDLISREALRKAIENYLAKRQDVIIWETDMFNMLDNAPTVEPEITNEDIQNAIKQGYNDGFEMAKEKFERPQGEWINTSPYDDKGECSLCCYLSKKYYKFCPNCGASMSRGDKE